MDRGPHADPEEIKTPMKLAWLGFPAFQHHMNAQGFETAFVPLPKPWVLDWEDICDKAGFQPDVLVYADRSFPPPLAGLDRFPCLTCFYAVDTHIHSWYPAYALAFDCCAVSLRDHLPPFVEGLGSERAIWLPAFPRDVDVPKWEAEKKWDVLFVGKVDPELTPARHVFLQELESLLPGRLHVTRGAYRDIFPHGRVVLNVAERGDLNFRVFEALACGSCLLTPGVGHGQDELFPPGECLETYEGGDASGAAEMIETLLGDSERRLALARTGHAEIEKRHRMAHRAKTLAGLLGAEAVRSARDERLARKPGLLPEVRAIYLHWAENLPAGELRSRYLAAATRSPK